MEILCSLGKAIKDRLKKGNAICLGLLLVVCYVYLYLGGDVFTDVFVAGDGAIHSIPSKIFSAQGLLWNPYVNSGTYTIKDCGSQACYLPGFIIMRIFPNIFGYNFCTLLHYWGAGAFTFLYLRKINLRKISSVFGAIVFIFCGYFNSHMSHYNMIYTAMYLPAVLLFVEKYTRERKIRNIFGAAIMFALAITADYPAVAMHIGMISVCYIIYKSFMYSKKQSMPVKAFIKESVFMCSMTYGIGLLLSAYYWVPVICAMPQTSRNAISYEFFNQFSISPINIITAIMPYAFGREGIGYWGLYEIFFYSGILPVILVAYAINKKDKQALEKFYLFICIASFVLAMGSYTPIGRIMYYVPLYNKFRCPGRIVLLLDFAVAALSAVTLDSVVKQKEHQKAARVKMVKIGLCFLICECLFTLGMAEIMDLLDGIVDPADERLANSIDPAFQFNRTIRETIDIGKEIYTLGGPVFWRTAIVIIISTAAIYMFFKIKRGWYIRGSCLLIVLFVDLFMFKLDGMNIIFSFNEYLESEETEWLRQQEGIVHGDYRILPMNYDANTEHIYPMRTELQALRTINTYGPIWLSDYLYLGDFAVSGELLNAEQMVLYNSFLSATATKYLLTDSSAYSDMLAAPDNDSEEKVLKINAVLLIDSEKTEKGYLMKRKTKDYAILCLDTEAHENRVYSISFDAKGLGETTEITLDYCDENPAHAQQQQAKATISNEMEHYELDIRTVNEIEGSGAWRIYTNSEETVEINNIVIKEKKIERWPYSKVYESKTGIEIWENSNAISRAHCVKQTVHADDIEEVKNVLYSSWYDPGRMAVTYGEAEEYADAQMIAADYTDEQKPNFIVQTQGKSLFVLEDTYDSGWKVKVNGEKTEIIKVNGFQRGVVLPKEGTFEIEFYFVPTTFYGGIIISAAGIFIILVCCLYEHKKNMEEQH